METPEITEKTPLLMRIKSILKYSLIGFGAVFVLFLIMDKIVMPVYVHLGNEIEMPDVTLTNSTDAILTLREMGFRITQEKKYDQYQNVGVVIQQYPAPYTIVKEGRTVKLVVSLGERKITVPDLLGVSERDAQIRLSERNLKLGEIFYTPSNSPEGTVVSQSYEPEFQVPKGTPVNISVSTGSGARDIVMPNLVFKSLNEAETMIKRRGLFLGTIGYYVDNNKLPNTILRQEPPPGTVLAQGDTVSVTASKIDSIAIDLNDF